MREILITLSSLSFIAYGFHCLFSKEMEKEFIRFGLKAFRILTGALELLGGLGLIVGLKYPVIAALASIGLTLLMFLGILARIRIRDRLSQCLPAIGLFAINLAIAVLYLRSW